MPSAIGSGPSRARSGISTATLPGSNTTTSPKVRGSTNHISLPSSRCITTCVCGGRSAPAAATSTCPLMRRWIITSSPESSGSSRYLPRRLAARIVVSVIPWMTASGDVRRTVRWRPTSTPLMRRPTANRSSPRRTVSTSGSSGIGQSPVSLEKAALAAACSAAFLERPSPTPSNCRLTSTLTWNRLSWSGPVARTT